MARCPTAPLPFFDALPVASTLLGSLSEYFHHFSRLFKTGSEMILYPVFECWPVTLPFQEKERSDLQGEGNAHVRTK